MHNIEILKMELEHIDRVMAVENLSFSIPWSKDAFVEEIESNKFAIYIVALVDTMVVGYAGMWKVCDEGHITNVAVHPEFRKNGVGSKLIGELLRISAMEGIKSLTLEVRKGNIPARRLYEKYGFKPEGLRKGYYADNGEDAVIMWKHGTDEE